jgi:serine protease
MPRSQRLLTLCFCLLIAIASANAAPRGKGSKTVNISNPLDGLRRTARYAPDRLIIKFKKSARLSKAQMTALTKGTQKHRFRSGARLFKLPKGKNVNQIIARLKKNPNVEYVQRDHYLKAHATKPNDELLEECWGLDNTGQTLGEIDADIDAPEAWDITTGSSDVIIAVIDTGVDYTHSDLAANMWINAGEIPDNGIDDDGNGYIDDVHGISVIAGEVSGDPYDDHAGLGHGTHVAGILGAVGNNSKGISGVNWNVRIMALKFLDSSGGGYESDAAICIDYAVTMGAHITNNSYGGPDHSQALLDAIVRSSNAGVLFVTSAGNATLDLDSIPAYPASYDVPNIISVAATEHSDSIAMFSNYGRNTVHVGAPGENIYSTVPGGNYQHADGTSMAGPMVAGIAGLVLANEPDISMADLRDRVLWTGDRLFSLETTTITGFRVNAHKALLGMYNVRIMNNPQLPNGTVSVPYSTDMEATGFSPPFTWSWEAKNYAEREGSNGFTFDGVAQDWKRDNSVWGLDLPFSFPFFDSTQTKVWVHSNGYLEFSATRPGTVDLPSGEDVTNKAIIGVFWTDLTTNGYYNDIYVWQPTPDSIAIRWQANETEWLWGGPVNCSAVLHSDGRIEMHYGPDFQTLVGGTVAISKGDGVDYYVSPKKNNSPYLSWAPSSRWYPGQLPPGLQINSATGEIYGTPTTVGIFNFDVTAQDTSDQGDSQPFEIKIDAANGPKADFEADVLESTLPATINFTDLTTNITGVATYLWNFGDGNSSTEASPAHVYTGGGLYTVSLTVTDETGTSHTKTKLRYIKIYSPGPTADFYATNTTGFGPLVVTFHDESEPLDPTDFFYDIFIWRWDFGDGQTQDRYDPYPFSHVYETSGDYTVKLLVLDLMENAGQMTREDYITVTEGTPPPAPDLSLSKTNNNTTLRPGDTTTYTLSLTNSGTRDASGIVLTDTLPANTTFNSASDSGVLSGNTVTWNIASLIVGETISRTITVTVNDSINAGADTIVNTASVVDDGTHGVDPNPLNNSATDSDTLLAGPNLGVTIDDGVTSTSAGATLVYTITVSNTGNQTATAITLLNVLPAEVTFSSASHDPWNFFGLLMWDIASLAPGATVTRTVEVTVNEPLPPGTTSIINPVDVGDDETNGMDPDPSNNSASDTDSIGGVLWPLTVQSSPVTPIAITGTGGTGGDTNYTVNVASGASITLTAPATASSGSTDYAFARWVLDGADQTDGVRDLTTQITSATTAKAEYVTVSRTLSVKSSPATDVVITGTNGSGGTTNYTKTLDDETSVTLTAPATVANGETNYTFVRWVLDGTNQTDGLRTLAITMSANHTVVAEYVRVNRTLTVQSTPITGVVITGTGGTTNYTVSVPDNGQASLTAPASVTKNDVTYAFSRWVIGGTGQDAGLRTVSVTLNANVTAVAEYTTAQGTHTLTVKSTPVTDIAIAGTNASGGTTDYTASLSDGTAATLTAPLTFANGQTDYTFVRWVLDGTNQTDGLRTLAITMSAPHTAVAEYVRVTRTLTVQSTPITGVVITGAGGTTNYTVSVPDNGQATLTAPASVSKNNVDYTFSRWVIGGTGQTAGLRTVSTTLNADTTAVAEYTIIKRTLTVQSTPVTGITITGTNGSGETTNYTVSLDDETSLTLTAPAAFANGQTDYTFVRWVLDGTNQTDGLRTLAITMSANHTAVAEYVRVTRTLTVQSTPITGVVITGAGGTTNYTVSVPDNGQASLTAPASVSKNNVDYTFSRWVIGGTGQTAGLRTVSTTLNADVTAVAEYAIVTRTLTVQATPITGIVITGTNGAGGTTNYTVTLSDETTTTLTAPASVTKNNVDYTFSRWVLGGANQAAGLRTLSITLSADVTAVAEYAVVTRTLTVQSTPVTGIAITGTNGAGGATNYSATLNDETATTLTAPASVTKDNIDYTFVRWVLGGANQTDDVTGLTLTLSADVTAVAEYAIVQHTLLVKSTPITDIAITGIKAGTTDYGVSVDDHASITLTAPTTHADGDGDYTFVRWIVGGVDQADDAKSTTITVEADVTCVAHYAPTQRTLTVESTPVTGAAILGTVAAQGTTNYSVSLDDNSEITLTAPATVTADNTDYAFVRWILDDIDQADGELGLTTTLQADAKTVAEYAIIQRTLTVQSSPIPTVTITGTNGAGGTTDYTVDLNDNSSTTLTAPTSVVEGDVDYVFVRWVVNTEAQTAGQVDVTLTLNAATTAVAEYAVATHTLTVESTPVSGIAITGTGGSGGTTDYLVSLDDEAQVTLTAPATFTDDGTDYAFVKWAIDDQDQANGEAAVTLTISADTTAVAHYAVITRTLSVSSTPVQGIGITGDAAGTTNYSADIADNAPITLTAPLSYANGETDYAFVQWVADGADQAAGETALTVTPNANMAVVAEYAVVQRTLTVQSSPIQTISITGTNEAGGTTDYTADLDDNTTTILTAPASASDGDIDYVFVRWVVDTIAQTDGQVNVSLTLNANITAVAEYAIVTHTLTIGSTPIQGITITGTGGTGGDTDYTVSVDDETEVTLTAPATFTQGAWAVPVTIPEVELLGDEFAATAWGGSVVRTDGPGSGVDFAFAGLGPANTGVKDDYPVDTVYGQILPSHANGDFSVFSGFALWVTNLDDEAVIMSLFINTGFNGPSGIPTNTLENDTFWHSLWQELQPNERALLFLDFNDAIPYHVEDNPPPHTQGGTDGVPMAINPYDRTEVDAIGFQIYTDDNPEAAVRVTPYSIIPEPATYYVAPTGDDTEVTLTAPATFTDGNVDYVFVRWVLDDVDQATGEADLALTVSADVTAVAQYAVVQRTLAVTSSPVGNVAITGTSGTSGTADYTVDVDDETSVSLTAPATASDGASDYTFQRWIVGGVNQPNDQMTVSLTVSTNVTAEAVYVLNTHTLTVQSTPVQGVAITSVYGTNGTTDYTAPIEDNSAVQLTAPASFAVGDTDYTFTRWVLDGAHQTDGVADLTFAAQADATAVAEYAIVQHTLTVQSTPIIGITITGTAGTGGDTDYTVSVDDETEVTLTAPATFTDGNADYVFVRWVLDGVDQADGEAALTITVSADATAKAEYVLATNVLNVKSTPIPGVTITGDAGGTTDYAVSIDDATQVTLTAPAAAADTGTDYTFVRWVLDGVDQADGVSDLTFEVNADRTATAVYAIVERTLTVQSSPIQDVAIIGTNGAGGTTDYAVALADNTSTTLTAPASASDGDVDYVFLRWTVDGAPQTDGVADATVTANADIALVAEYEVIQHTLTVQSTPALGVTITGTVNAGGDTDYEVTLDDETSATLTAPTTASSGSLDYTFTHWSVNGVDGSAGVAELTVLLKADTTVTAHYALDQHSVSITSSPVTSVVITSTTDTPGTTPYTATVDDEATVTLTAPATHTDAGTDYEFVRWLLDGAGQTNGVHDLTLVMERDATAVAEYAIVSRTLAVQSTPISAVTITGTAGSGGTTDYTAAIPDHTTITLTAPASLDDSSYTYTFSHWKLDGQDQQAGKTDVTVTLEANVTAIAVYTEEAKTWTLSILAPEGSGATVPGTGSHGYDIFTDASATATAATGWHFVRWEGTAVVAGQEADNPITIAAGIADETKTLKAVFAEDALLQEEIVDNTDTGASKSFEAVSGTWKPSTYESGYYGSNYAYASASAGAETARARWQCTTLAAGTYEVYVRWSGSSSRASNAPYVIKNGDTELATVRVDQRPSGSEWFLLGTYAFDAGSHKVELHNGATSGKYITADAVRFLQTDDTPPPPADKGSLSITLTPAEAIAVGAQWRVNGSAWQDSGATVADLNVGNAAVEYQSVVGYTAPAAEAATITKDTTSVLVRTYTVAVLVSEEIIDNTDTGASKSFEAVSGTWKSSTYEPGYYGSNYAYASASAGAETARARWQCTTLAAGTYEVYVRWSGSSSRASNAPYVIKNGDTELATVRVDQRPSGSEWFLLGTYAFDAGAHKVEIHNGATTGQYITADAVRFLQTDDTPPPPADKGSLSITLTPAEAIAVGAQWRVNGSAWQDSGATVADLNVGNAAVEYQVVVGYTAPAAEAATITKDTTTALARTYAVAVPVSEEIIDNTDTGASKSFEAVSGTWKSSTYVSGYYGSSYAFASASAGAETARARWQCTTLAAGTYEVYVRWSGAESRASNAPYVIKNGDTELATVRVDQRPSGKEWFLLGTYAFDAGSHKVELHNGATTGQYITADAVRFLQTDDTPPPPADKGSLSITLTPAEAIAVGAQWRVNGSAWQDSGATVADLKVGNAAVEYQSVVGYTAPAAEAATITKDTTTALVRTYTVAVPVSEEIIDNTDTGASKSFEVVSGTWKSSTYESGYYGSNYAYASATTGAETARARWSCSTLAAGTYEVYVRWSGSSSRASNAPYVIKNGDTELATVRVDQRPNGSEWFLLGTYAFDAGAHKVEIHNGATTGQYITADAVRFLRKP